MYIETTANIDKGTYQLIKSTAKELGVSARKLVSVLLKIVVKEMPFDYRIYRTVEYQADRPKEDWVCFHLRLTGAVYESGHDMRKLMKYSLSFLLCYAVRVYLEEAVKILTEDENLLVILTYIASAPSTQKKSQHLPYSIHFQMKKTYPATSPTATNTHNPPKTSQNHPHPRLLAIRTHPVSNVT